MADKYDFNEVEHFLTGAAKAFQEAIIEDFGRDMGFVILMFELNNADGISHYASNANRSDMVKGLREAADAIEQLLDTPKEYTPQTECYYCKYARPISNAHIQCANPDKNVKGDRNGYLKGGFLYPYNFNPIWKLNTCANFEHKKE